ncbi:MAG: hypothetical protein JNM72_11975 [Deltaproteobacteria bacterium]|nr:hypothetical protein [Deltaproteobacteria bacterium]
MGQLTRPVAMGAAGGLLGWLLRLAELVSTLVVVLKGWRPHIVVIDGARRSTPSLRGLSACSLRPATRPAWDRAANLLEPTWSAPANVSAVLVEVGFVNQRPHAGLLTDEGVEVVAGTLVLV